MNVLRLDGCAPTPLAHYLKALAVLRLVAEQVDPEARGMWVDERFVLVTRLTADELSKFFLNDYVPTPLVTPWNGGSGFYPKDNVAGVDAISASTHPRMSAYRDAIAWCRIAVAGLDQRPEKEGKAALIQRCRREWSGDALVWLNACVAVVDGEPAYPALLGTGGNDGRFDFSNNFMQWLTALLPDGVPAPGAADTLRASLYGATSAGEVSATVGQFLPGNAGGMNSASGFDGKSKVNPWDFVLMLEGTLAFQVAVVRQLDTSGLAVASAPFAVRGQAAGFGSAVRSEESARGEQWVPLWSRAARWNELQAVFREGRMQGRSGRARQPLDVARAVAAHGTARGIEAFQRYAYLERNGLSNLAVPVGRWTVRASGASRLLDGIEPWVESLRSASRDEARDPETLRRAVRGLETAMLALAASGPRPTAVQDLLVRLGATEAELTTRPRHTADHPGLRPLTLKDGFAEAWVREADDQSAEFRLALAFATSRVDRERVPGGRRSLSMKAYAAPLDEDSPWKFAIAGGALRDDVRVVWRGRSVVADLLGVARRRWIESEQAGDPGLGITPHAYAQLSDIRAFVAGELDERRLGRLVRGLMCVQLAGRVDLPRRPFDRRPLLPAYALIRSAFPGRVADLRIRGREVETATLKVVDGGDPLILSLLAAGRAVDASERAARRVAVATGSRATLPRFVADRALCQRIGASLMFPISTSSLARVLGSVFHPYAMDPGEAPRESEGVSA